MEQDPTPTELGAKLQLERGEGVGVGSLPVEKNWVQRGHPVLVRVLHNPGSTELKQHPQVGPHLMSWFSRCLVHQAQQTSIRLEWDNPAPSSAAQPKQTNASPTESE